MIKTSLCALLLLVCSACGDDKSGTVTAPASTSATTVVTPTPTPGTPSTPGAPVVPTDPCKGITSTVSDFSDGGFYVGLTNCATTPQTYVFVSFQRQPPDFFAVQTVSQMLDGFLMQGAHGSMSLTPLVTCYQTDLFQGVTVAQIVSGAVKINPAQEGAPGYLKPIAAFLSACTPSLLPPLPPPVTTACVNALGANVSWIVQSSASLDVGSTVIGNILALASISMNTGATLHGRALARTGAVTLTGSNVVSNDSDCPNTLNTALYPYAVLAASTVTCTAVSNVNGDIGVSPGTAITGFPSPCTDVGTLRRPPAADPAQIALTADFTTLAGLSCGSTIGPDLSGLTLTPGTYCVTAGSTNLTGTLTLDTLGNPAAPFIFQMQSTLIMSPGSTVRVQ